MDEEQVSSDWVQHAAVKETEALGINDTSPSLSKVVVRASSIFLSFSKGPPYGR